MLNKIGNFKRWWGNLKRRWWQRYKKWPEPTTVIEGKGTYDSLTNAISAAESGDVIRLGSGTYPMP